MSYEVKRTTTINELRPWDVWKDGKCVSPGWSSKSAADIEKEVRIGLDMLRARKLEAQQGKMQ